MIDKATRQRFGVRGTPIPAVKAFKKSMDFDHAHVTTASWILIRPDGRRTHVNTYNGNLGRNVDYEESTHAFPTEAKQAKSVMKGYDEVPVAECPVAEVAEVVAPPAPPAE